jgi:hypothetical protein
MQQTLSREGFAALTRIGNLTRVYILPTVKK